MTALLLYAITTTLAVSHEPSRSPYVLDRELDAATIAVATTSILVPYAFASSFITPHCPCDPGSVNAFDRGAIGNHDVFADRASDVLVGLSLAAPILIDAFDAPSSEELAADLVVYAEVLAVTGAITAIVKYATQRPLPVIYSNDDPALLHDPGGYRSFFSGHTALTVAALTAAAERATSRHGRSFWPWLAPIAAGALVGFLRVEAGRHFPTDVIAGAGVGLLVGWTIPSLHE